MQYGDTASTSFVGRMVGAARLNRDVYEEIEHDRRATGQAAIVVLGTSLAAGIGGVAEVGIIGLAAFTAAGLVGWAAYAWLAYFIGTRIFRTAETSADWGEVARTLGFASSPRVLLLLGLVPGILGAVSFVVGVWLVLTTISALKAALELGTWRAVGTALVALIVQGMIFSIVFAIIG
ncbi:MAG: hypothetical protein OXC56_07170 [Chloroflexi bacterium]|nr:hypothetical protein [Chloroflexota bacterium]